MGNETARPGRAWMPNRHASPLHFVEAMAETASARTRAAAAMTGNWPLVRCLDALAEDARQRRKQQATR